jgi:tetratricopeptide (TPR) repeat protein
MSIPSFADCLPGSPLMKRLLSSIVLVVVAATAAAPAFAADLSPAANDKLAAARRQIEAKQWGPAIAELRQINDPASADWNNLMGYSLRKQATPDYAGAARFYDEALKIDPKHRGALEYSGELFLITGDLPKAEERLATLDKACRFSCEEYRDLKRSVERYKANGNKYVVSQ